jgi:protein gp37
MAENSKIQWTHHTFNPWRGCTKVSGGCKFCYADKLSKRNPKTLGIWGPNGTRVIAAESAWREVYSWNRKAKEAGERHRVFCASLADVGEGPETMPDGSWIDVQAARTRLSVLIMECEHLQFLLLTKRPENMTKYFDAQVLERSWVGTSVENQAAADERIPRLLSIPAAVRFLSCEPLLGDVDLRYVAIEPPTIALNALTGEIWNVAYGGEQPFGKGPVHWVICGCESGAQRRPMQSDWARSIRDQCKSAGVPFFMKQMECGLPGRVVGELEDFPSDLRVREFPLSPGGER